MINRAIAVTDPLGHVFWWGILAILIGGAIAVLGALTGSQKLFAAGRKIVLIGLFVWLAIMAYVFLFFYSHSSQ